MHLLHEVDQENDLSRFTLEITMADFAKAEYGPHDRQMIRMLEAQQEENPTVEGALMILQMHARAIQRAKGIED